MSTKGRSVTRKLLSPLTPRECLVVADVTRTILNQRAGGFSRRMQLLITTFIEAGGVLCAVTGDSFDTIEEHLLRPLNYRGSHTFFVITGAGSRIDAIGPDGVTRVHSGPKVTKSARCDLLGSIEQILSAEFATSFTFSASTRRQLLSSRGERIEVAAKFGLVEPLYVEIRPEKGVTLFMEGSSDYGGHKLTLLKRFANDRQVRVIAKAEKLRISLGSDYIDLITSTKYQALASYFKLKEIASLELDSRVVIALGDSPNDEGLFTYPYATNRQVIALFVGDDRVFFEKVRLVNSTPNLVHLDGEFTLGTEFALGQICKGT